MADPAPSAGVIPGVLFFLVPTFAVILTGRAVARHGSAILSAEGRPERYAAYAMVATLSVTSTLVGAMGSTHVHASGSTKAVRALQAMLGLLVGIPVLHLCGVPGPLQLRSPRFAVRMGALYTGTLVVILCCATLLALLAPFLPAAPSVQSASVPAYLAPALFLAYTALALPHIVRALLARRLAPTHSAPFPKIEIAMQSGATSPAFHTDFGFDPSIRAPATLRGFRFPVPPPINTPNAAFSTATASSTSKAVSTCIPTPNSTPTSSRAWLGRLRGALRAGRSSKSGGPIAIHVATQRTSWAHDAESEVEEAAEEGTGRPGDVQRGEVGYPPRPQQPPTSQYLYHYHHHYQFGIKATPLTPIASAIELPYSALDREVRPDRRDSGIDLDLDLDAESSEEAYTRSVKRDSLEEAYTGRLSAGKGPFGRGIDSSAGRGQAVVAHITLPTSWPQLRSRFSTGGDSLPVDGTDDGGARAEMRGCLLWIFGAQLASGAAWACALAAAVFAVSESARTVKIVQAACTVLAVVGTVVAYFVHAGSDLDNREGRKTSYLTGNAAATTTSTQTTSPQSAITMDMALHSTFPVSALAYGRPTPTLSDIRHNANTSTYTYTSDTNYSTTTAGPDEYADVRRYSEAHKYITPRRRLDASVEEETMYAHARKASACASSSGGSHAHEPLLAALMEKGDAENKQERERQAWGASVEGVYAEERAQAEASEEDMEQEERGATRALLVRSNTAATPSAGASRTRVRRASFRRRSTATTTSAHMLTGSAGQASVARHRKHATEDPGAYIRKRGSASSAAPARRFFGWEFGGAGEGSEAPGQEASFIDLRGGARKTKRQSLLSGIATLASGEAEGAPALGRSISTARKLKKTPKSRPHPEPADTAGATMGHPLSHWARHAETDPAAPSIAPDSPSALAFCLGRLGHHRRTSQRTVAMPAADTEAEQHPGAMTRAVQLKKSFKLGVGRTMGPGLTLAVAECAEPEEALTPAMRERQRYYNAERERERAAAALRREEAVDAGSGASVGGEEKGGEVDPDEDDEGEIQSIATARLVSASIARATPAATIMAAPATPVRSTYRTSYSSAYNSNPAQEATPKGFARPSIAVNVTSGGSMSPQSPLSPTSWKPHPFADPAEELEALPSPVKVVLEEGPAEDDDVDDLVQLEREMEREVDSEKAMRDFNATLNPVSIPAAAHNKPEEKVGRPQKRLTLSSPPVPKSDWTPQAAGSGGFAYRFPMIFGPSMAPSSRPDSPTRSQAIPQSSQRQSMQPSSTLSTPRSASNLRLPSRTMDTVRSAFAGVGARMSGATSRMSVTSSVATTPTRGAPAQTLGELLIVEDADADGDFMDLRDPFAPPPPATTVLPKAVVKSVAKPWDNFLVIDSYEPEEARDGAGKVSGGRTRRRRMSAWGRLPMPARTLSPVPSSGAASVATGAAVAAAKKGAKAANRLSRGKGGARKGKEKRTRKATLSSVAGALAAAKVVGGRAGGEDADFGLEEALLSQRLLRRLNSTEWEGPA